MFANDPRAVIEGDNRQIMTQEEHDIALIEAYLSKTLGDKALHELESRLANDPDFTQKLEDYRVIMEELQQEGADDFMDKLQGWEHDIHSKIDTKDSISRKFPYWQLAAVITLILIPIAVWWFSQDFGGRDAEELYAAYFVPYEDVLSSRTADASQINQAMAEYNDGEYEIAIVLFFEILENDPDNEAIRCYQAISYLALEGSAQSKPVFEDLATNSSGLYKEVSEWYLVLWHLKMEEMDGVKVWLEVILDDETHIFYEKASDLKREL